MLSRTTHHALRAAAILAAGGQATSTQIAQATGLPRGYMAKVLAILARRGLVVSTRGRRGGFRLARAPSAVSLFDIVTAFENLDDSARAPRAQASPLDLALRRVAAATAEALRHTSLADVRVPDASSTAASPHRRSRSKPASM
ncbi:MAG: Rrf2 family transcriptional regulator [Phycisphaeraceae bacterium]|nr:Rrf2 family transcriptional regulator [Phycisphaeraceae bacterium]